ncbi:zinc finger protein 16 [Oryzias melastigma]|uniref:Zinc finger protein 16-like n=1 Tax=Oryzias melastigma TaxID=30732 RepID=A0A3B3BWD6_ORYME|nr:zinc finger protein 16 [Oryzias melastigma]
MSSVHSLRVFISERLTSAAEEIFREFEKTIVQYEEEMDRQRRLLDSSWKRNTITADLQQKHTWKEKQNVVDQHLFSQERSCSQNQKDAEPPQITEQQEEEEMGCLLENIWEPELELHRADVRQLPVCKEDEELRSKEHLSQSPHIKEEQDDLCAEEEGGQPELKQESETFMLPSSSEERDLHAAEPTSEQLLSESQDQQQVKLEDFESTEAAEIQRTVCWNINVEESPLSETGAGERSAWRSPSRTMSPPSTFRRHSDATDIRRQPGEKSNFCEVCRKCFRSVSVLKVHMRIHTGEKPFFCQICGKRCRQQSDLGRHMMAHTGERPFPCHLCEKSFIQKGDLLRHMKVHMDERQFPCALCTKTFSENDQLSRHMRNHTRKKPYSCKVCKKMFVKKAHLTAHARTHTGEKPFLCDTCGRGFINRSNLTRHKKVHTGEKPFICSVCLKTFSRNEHLWSHMMLHKGEGTLTSR